MIFPDGCHTFSNGNKVWHKNNLLHREDGPAIENTNGSQVWYLNGKRHRVGGPAYYTSGCSLTKGTIPATGYREYYVNGKRHREDGPACEWASGYVEYFLNGEYIDTLQEYERMLRLKAFW
jgi:hypothetical protein